MRSSARSIESTRGADDLGLRAFERLLEAGGEIERRLPAELDDDAVRLLLVADVEDVLERERLEEKFVAGVVVGRDGLRVRVDHDGLVPDFLQREGGVDATVVELDALADAVRPAAEDHDLLLVRVAHFVEPVVVGGVVVGRVGLELGRAGVDEAVGGVEVDFSAEVADLIFRRSTSSGDLSIRETESLSTLDLHRVFFHRRFEPIVKDFRSHLIGR